MPFNENHKRYLLATFQHVDKLLAQAVAGLGQADGDLLFPSCLPDVSPTQRRVIADYLASFRRVARRFLEAVPVHPDAPSKGGLWTFRVALDFVWIALAEAEPKRLGNYGALDADAAQQTKQVLAGLQLILGQLTEYVDRGMSGEMHAHE